MHLILDKLPWLIAMVVLLTCSAFFSASEAALFYLRPRERRALKSGNRSQRACAVMLADSERLLSAILFWNLVVNITYFAIISLASLDLQRHPAVGKTEAVAFSIGALMLIILFSEMLPKSLAVASAPMLVRLVGLPLAAAVRAVDCLIPLMRMVNLLSRRLIWPRFQPEPYLEISDLERAIQLSTNDAQLIDQEQVVLQNIVSLTEMRVDESMRPRMQFLSFRPPVSLDDLEGRLTPSGYLLVTDPDRDEVVGAIHLRNLTDVRHEHLEHLAEPVVFVPWFTTVATALQQMQSYDREVAAVVNELGETIGILTFEDILDTVFTFSSTRSSRLLKRQSILQVEPDVWHVTGMTSLRRLGRHFSVKLPESKSVTVAGITQEVLERLPVPGDQYQWGPFSLRVIDVPERGPLTVELTCNTSKEINS